MGQELGRAEADSQQMLAMLPAGWRGLGRARLGPAPHGCHVLANPERGVALVDVAPEATPRAEARLRAALTASGFAFAYSGMLPVVHVRVELSGLALVQPLLEGGFAAQPPVGIARPGWVEGVAAALATRPDWSDPEPEPRAPRGPAWRLARWSMAGLALAATFAGGVLLGAHTSPVPVRAPMPMPVSSETPPPSVVAIEAPALPELPPLPPEPTPALPPVVELQAEAAPAELPRPRPASARRNLEIDPGCAEAVLRYQQGLALSWGEMAHVRNGCRSVVRR